VADRRLTGTRAWARLQGRGGSIARAFRRAGDRRERGLRFGLSVARGVALPGPPDGSLYLRGSPAAVPVCSPSKTSMTAIRGASGILGYKRSDRCTAGLCKKTQGAEFAKTVTRGAMEAARGCFAYERHRPAIAYSRVGTARTLSAVLSSSTFLASHLGSEFGLIARSYRAFSSPLIAP
jgi:hypothetical protein